MMEKKHNWEFHADLNVVIIQSCLAILLILIMLCGICYALVLLIDSLVPLLKRDSSGGSSGGISDDEIKFDCEKQQQQKKCLCRPFSSLLDVEQKKEGREEREEIVTSSFFFVFELIFLFGLTYWCLVALQAMILQIGQSIASKEIYGCAAI